MGDWDAKPSDPVADIRALMESESRGGYQCDALLGKLVDWLPKKVGNRLYHYEIRGSTLLLSRAALEKCLALPDGVDWHPTLEGMTEK